MEKIELCSLRADNKKLFNHLVSETFITNLANFQKSFPCDSVDMANNFLERIYGAGRNVYLEIVERKTGLTIGFLWYRLHNEKLYSDMAYICFLCILSPHRRKGYAAIALKLLKKYLKKEKGIARIALAVSVHNNSALRLYESAGFEPMEITMQKIL